MSNNPTISALRCWVVRLPFDHGAPAPLFAGRPRTTIDSCWIQLELSNGLVGWGEAYAGDPGAVVSLVRNRVEPLLLGKPVNDMGLVGHTERTLHNMGRSGPVLHALAGVDIALWDVRAQLAQVPLHVLLGGAKRSQVPAYASLLQYYGNADHIRSNTEAALKAGFATIKLHERTAAAGLSAREVMGAGAPLMMDTNCAWLPEAAAPEANAMLACDPYWIEEPVWPPENLDALRDLKRAVAVPLAAGENAASVYELLQCAQGGVVDWVQPSMIKCGLSVLRDVAAACSPTVKFSPQTAFFGPGFLATLHLLAAQNEAVVVERLFCRLDNDPYAQGLVFDRGAFVLPEGPGLGLEPDADALHRACAI